MVHWPHLALNKKIKIKNKSHWEAMTTVTSLNSMLYQKIDDIHLPIVYNKGAKHKIQNILTNKITWVCSVWLPWSVSNYLFQFVESQVTSLRLKLPFRWNFYTKRFPLSNTTSLRNYWTKSLSHSGSFECSSLDLHFIHTGTFPKCVDN